MIFLISRASCLPREEDALKDRMFLQQLCLKQKISDERLEMYQKMGNNWYATGTHYVDEEGQHVRELTGEQWCIELNSLSEITDLIDEVGEGVVILPSESYEGMYKIIIYDDYLE